MAWRFHFPIRKHDFNLNIDTLTLKDIIVQQELQF